MSPSSADASAGLVETTILVGSERHRIWFRDVEGTLSPSTESAVTAVLLPCMKTGNRVRVAGSADALFLESIGKIQDLLCSWDPSLSRVDLDVRPSAASRSPEASGTRTGTFFSGGVDSFYTLIKHREEISDLIFIHGFDFTLDNERLRREASRAVRDVAAGMGKGLVEVETNLRTCLARYVPWQWAHGAALATVGHLLSSRFKQIFIPASHTYADSFPWGSHPLLDPLWSTSTLSFVHDGAEATRVHKVAVVSREAIVLKSLRVCLENDDGAYNCGRCEKCLRTMVNLRIAGVLDRCTTFRAQLDPRRLSRVFASNDNTVAFARENLEALEQRDEDPELADALRRVLRRARLLGSIQAFRKKMQASSALWCSAETTAKRLLGRTRPWKTSHWEP